MNYLLYKSCSTEKFSFHRFQKNITEVESLVENCKVRFYAVDGPGPKSKLYTQRTRREKRRNAASLQLTPGTKLMEAIKSIFCTYIAHSVNLQSSPQQVFFSGPDDIGEGELKIFEHLNSICPSEVEEGNEPKIRSLLLTGDSDCILYGLRNPHLTLDLLVNNTYLINIPTLQELIYDKVIEKNRTNSNLITKESVLNDFVFLIVLNGSDYLQALRYYSFHYAWDAYLTLRHDFAETPLIKKIDSHHYQLNTTFLKSIYNMTSKALYEPPVEKYFSVSTEKSALQLLNEYYQKIFKSSPSTSTSSITTKPIDPVGSVFESVYQLQGKVFATAQGTTAKLAKEKCIESAIVDLDKMLPAGCTAPSRFVSLLPKLDRTVSSDIDLKMTKYLDGLAWIMEYLLGNCHDYSYFYPFSVAPTFSEFIQWEGLSKPIKVPRSPDLPLSPLEFSMALIPPSAASKYLNPPFDKIQLKSWNQGIDEVLKEVRETVTPYFNRPEISGLRFSPPLLFTRHPPSHMTSSLSNYHFDIPTNFLFPKKLEVSNPPIICLSSSPNNRLHHSFNSPFNPFMRIKGETHIRS